MVKNTSNLDKTSKKKEKANDSVERVRRKSGSDKPELKLGDLTRSLRILEFNLYKNPTTVKKDAALPSTETKEGKEKSRFSTKKYNAALKKKHQKAKLLFVSRGAAVAIFKKHLQDLVRDFPPRLLDLTPPKVGERGDIDLEKERRLPSIPQLSEAAGDLIALGLSTSVDKLLSLCSGQMSSHGRSTLSLEDVNSAIEISKRGESSSREMLRYARPYETVVTTGKKKG